MSPMTFGNSVFLSSDADMAASHKVTDYLVKDAS